MAEIVGKLDVEKALKMLVYLYTDGRLEVTEITPKESAGESDEAVLQHKEIDHKPANGERIEGG